jgi:PAS domain S-box-containing protein
MLENDFDVSRLRASTPSVEFLADIIEQLPHPMFVKDRQFRYVLVNSALVSLGNYSFEQILGKTDYDFLPKVTADLYRAQDEEMFATGVEVTIDAEVITVEGERRVFSTRKVPLRRANSEVTHVVGIISDITLLKTVEEDLRVSTEELERRVAERTQALAVALDDLGRKERLTVLGRLAAGVAHQIRNPLGAIKNAAYVVDRRIREIQPPPFASAAVNEEVGEAIAIVHDEVQRANRIITDLLDYARMRVPVRRPTSLATVVEQAISTLGSVGSIHIVRSLPDLPSAALDAEQLQGALYNVLRNAVEAMPDGGTLTVETELRDAALVVRIFDTGDGIPAEVRGRLFEPLITTKQLGMGLGLVTARTMIEGQGGTIECVRSDENGACFEITLPRAPGSSPPSR